MKLSQRQCFIILFAIVILLSALQLTVGGELNQLVDSECARERYHLGYPCSTNVVNLVDC